MSYAASDTEQATDISTYPALVYVTYNGDIYLEMTQTSNLTYGHIIIKQYAIENGRYLSSKHLYPRLPIFSRVSSGRLITFPPTQEGTRGVFSFDSIHSAPIQELSPVFKALVKADIFPLNSTGKPINLLH